MKVVKFKSCLSDFYTLAYSLCHKICSQMSLKPKCEPLLYYFKQGMLDMFTRSN